MPKALENYPKILDNEIEPLALKLLKVNDSALKLGYELFLLKESESKKSYNSGSVKNSAISTSTSSGSTVTSNSAEGSVKLMAANPLKNPLNQFRTSSEYLQASPMTKQLIEGIARDFSDEVALIKNRMEKKKEEEEENDEKKSKERFKDSISKESISREELAKGSKGVIMGVTKGAVEELASAKLKRLQNSAALFSRQQDIEDFLRDYPRIAYRLRERLNQYEENKAKAKWWMEWIARPFKSDGFLGGTTKSLSRLPSPIGDIFSGFNDAFEYIGQLARLRAMQYDPDLIKPTELTEEKTILMGASFGIGALGKAAALTGLIIAGLALTPITAAIAGFGIAISEMISCGVSIRNLWQSYKRDGKFDWDLFAGVLKSGGRTLAGIAVGIAGVAATVVASPILAVVAMTGLCVSAAIYSVNEAMITYQEWPAKPGETTRETYQRRFSNVSSFVNRLAVTLLTALAAAAAIMLIANPIGLAAVATGFMIGGLVAAAVSFATFIGPKISSFFVKSKDTKDSIEKTIANSDSDLSVKKKEQEKNALLKPKEKLSESASNTEQLSVDLANRLKKDQEDFQALQEQEKKGDGFLLQESGEKKMVQGSGERKLVQESGERKMIQGSVERKMPVNHNLLIQEQDFMARKNILHEGIAQERKNKLQEDMTHQVREGMLQKDTTQVKGNKFQEDTAQVQEDKSQRDRVQTRQDKFQRDRAEGDKTQVDRTQEREDKLKEDKGQDQEKDSRLKSKEQAKEQRSESGHLPMGPGHHHDDQD